MSDKRIARITRRYKDAGDWCRAEIVATARVGGSYADLTFAGAVEPIEVIGIWDYAAGESELGPERGELRRILLQWVRDQDAEEYQDAASVTDDAAELSNLRRRPRRRWLLTYLENSDLR